MNLLYRMIFSSLCFGVRALLKLRYRIQVQGLDAILQHPKEGVLFLPNHPSELDPVMLMSLLGPRFFPRALVVQHFYELKGFQWLLDFARVVPIPSMDQQTSRWKGKEVEKTLQSVLSDIKQGQSYLIYPSGRLKRSALEQLGGASFVYQLLSQSKGSFPVVLIRTRGLWGSRFSVAQTGKSPSFGATLWQSCLDLCKNGLFWMPKRDIQIELELASQELFLQKSRAEMNRYLEQWYNHFGPEPIRLVPYHKNKPVVVQTEREIEEEALVFVPPHIQKEVVQHLALLSGKNIEEIHLSDHLAFDLGLDSLDTADLQTFLGKKYGAVDRQFETVQELLQAVCRIKERKVVTTPQDLLLQKAFLQKEERKDLQIPAGDLVTQAFLQSCDRMKGLVACADRRSGLFSYRALKRAALVLSLEIAKWPEEQIGLLLPSSIASYLSTMAVLLAGKVPVMLNWTAGKIALDQAVSVGTLSKVITSRAFLEKIPFEELGIVEELFVYLEEIKRKLSWRKKLLGALMSSFPSRLLVSLLPLEKDPSKPAVLLFTSGSEALPKAVPLSHHNLLQNQRDVLQTALLHSFDVLYGVLPPFHSFGLSLTGLFPLLCGLKVFYAPDPTDSASMLLDHQTMKPTILCSAPGFLLSLFSLASKDDLQHLRLVVCGAEKTPQRLYELIEEKAMQALCLEGYGITECSPVVTLQRITQSRKGVGSALAHVDLCIVHPESLQPVLKGEEGEILIRGNAVFSGYLEETSSPFVEVEGVSWYRSGDRGYLDQEGILYLTGRLKRFVKIGGEMVSLGAIEELLLQTAQKKGWLSSSVEGVPLAVLSVEKELGRPELVVCATFPISKEEMNFALRDGGMSKIVKIHQVIPMDQIPLSGTGKIQYRLLKQELEKHAPV